MEIQLTKKSLKFLKIIYKEYKHRLKSKLSFSKAIDFEDSNLYSNKLFPKWDQRLIWNICHELGKHGLIRNHLRGSFLLQREGIAFIEQQKKNIIKNIYGKLLVLLPR